MTDLWTIAARVRQTADKIESEGWFREIRDPDTGRWTLDRYPAKPDATRCHCILTAMPDVEMHLIPYYFAMFMGHDLTFNDASDFVTDWNDKQTDPAVVVAKLRECADWLDSKEVALV